ncbi:hypothetical protein ABZ136_34635, partial [Streptomyces microflavus]
EVFTSSAVGVTISVPFCAWMMKGFFDTIPREIDLLGGLALLSGGGLRRSARGSRTAAGRLRGAGRGDGGGQEGRQHDGDRPVPLHG